MSQVGIAPSKSNCNASMQDFAKLGGDLLSLSVDSSLKYARAVMDMLIPTLSGMNVPCMSRSCEIPETDCPPRCVCKIEWDVCKGDHRQHAIRITNTAKKDVVFNLVVKPFDGLDETPDLITVNPDSMVLKPGEKGTSVVTLAVPANAPSGEYNTEILVRGQYEQCIQVALTIRNAGQCICEVSQGEIPVRIRAHHWYDHFQCVEPCFEPILRRDEAKPIDVAAAAKQRP